MARKSINIGTPNNNDGDLVRDAFSKSEDNFIELYDIEHNNFIRIIDIDTVDLLGGVVSEGSVAKYLNELGVEVSAIEIIAFNFSTRETIPEPPAPEPIVNPYEPPVEDQYLDDSIDLILSYANLEETEVDFNWGNNGDTNIVGYRLFYTNIDSGQTYSYPATNRTIALTYHAINLINNTNYSAYLIAYGNVSGDEKISNTVTFKTPTTYIAPTTPEIHLVDKTDTTINLAWSVNSSFGADNYKLYQIGNPTPILDGFFTSFVVTGLTQNTTYQYYVVAYNGAIPSDQSNTLTVTTDLTVLPPLSKPILKVISVSKNSVELTFNVDSDHLYEINRIKGWKLQYRLKGNTDWSSKDYNSGALTYDLLSLVLLTSYEFRVASTDGEVYSPYSDIVESKTLGDLGASIFLNIDSDNQTGVIRIKGGEASTDLKIEVAVQTKDSNGISISSGSITFDIGGTILSGQSSTRTLPIGANRLSTALDGQFIINTVTGLSPVGTTITISATIIYSVNGVNINTAVETYTQTLTDLS